jgi:hypothetical protein
MNVFGFDNFDNNESSIPKLTIELVPSTSWGDNLRSKLPKDTWDVLRRKCYQDADYCCEVCGKRGLVHAHEIWNYDDEKHIQKLNRLIALCPTCHGVKHFGRTQAIGKGEEALKHLMVVNSWTRKQVLDYVAKSFAIWQKRSQYIWKVDISVIAA